MVESLSGGGAGVPGSRLIRVVSVIRITADYGDQTTSKRYHLRLRVECTLFCNLQSRAWTQTGLVIGFDLISIFLCFNATFSNISAIPWRPVLMVEEAGVPGENYRPRQTTGKLYHLRLRVECTLFLIYKAGGRKHAVLVISLYELLDPTT